MHVHTKNRSTKGWIVTGAVLVAVAVTGLLLGQGHSSHAGRVPGGGSPEATVIVRDSFKRTATGLGKADTGQVWRQVAGHWATGAGLVRVTATAGRAIAVVDGGTGTRTLHVVLSQPCSGCGLVFRFRDRRNYWMVVEVPKFATFNLVKVTAGQPKAVGNTGLTTTKPGTKLAVRLNGTSVAVAVNGFQKLEVVDKELSTASGVGLVAGATDATAGRFAALLETATADAFLRPAPTASVSSSRAP